MGFEEVGSGSGLGTKDPGQAVEVYEQMGLLWERVNRERKMKQIIQGCKIWVKAL